MKSFQIILLFAILHICSFLNAQECYDCIGVTGVLDVNGNASLIVDGQVTFTDCTEDIVASYSPTDPTMNIITITCDDINPSNGGFVFFPIYMYLDGVLINDQIACLSDGLAFVVFNNYTDICCPNEGDCIVVPVEWISFNGESIEGGNQLQWHVNEDTQVDYYKVQRRSDEDIEFKTIAIVQSTFKTDNANYEFVDDSAGEGVRYYYRLQQFDLDGNYSFSNVISLKQTITNHAELEIFPNPASDRLEISFVTPTNTNTEIRLFNIAGLEISTDLLDIPHNIESGSRSISANIESLETGVYTITLDNGGERIVRRFMKL